MLAVLWKSFLLNVLLFFAFHSRRKVKMGWGRSAAEAEKGYTSQGYRKYGNSETRRKPAPCLEGIRHLRSLGLARAHQRKLTLWSGHTYGGPTLCLREIHAPTRKYAGTQASKKALSPGSAVGLSRRDSQWR